MFWFVVDILMLRRLGLGRWMRYLLLVLILGCLISAVVYVTVVFEGLNERSRHIHVHTRNTD